MIGTGIGIPMDFGESWSLYWATQDEVLFFGEISKITDGKLYNQKTGATDYLTVVGVAGSYNFQAPNTAPYIAADTDYIWFKTDALQRTTTTAELIGYDLQRTPVKYLDDAPNTLEAIMILSSAVTGAKRDRMFRDFHLPILWDNSLNANGYVKSNRGASQQLWTPESVYPAYLTDANTVAWYTGDTANVDLTGVAPNQTVTKLKDVNGINDLLPPVNRLTYWADSIITFDNTIAVANRSALEKEFAWALPNMIYMVIRQNNHVSNARIISDVAANSPYVRQDATEGKIGVAGNFNEIVSDGKAIGSWFILRVLFKVGVNASKVIIDDGTPLVGTLTDQDLGGILLGGTYLFAGNCGFSMKEMVARNSEAGETEIYTYLKNKYSL